MTVLRKFKRYKGKSTDKTHTHTHTHTHRQIDRDKHVECYRDREKFTDKVFGE